MSRTASQQQPTCYVHVYMHIAHYILHWVLLLSNVISRLRSPKAPDESADMGQHSFAYAVMPHKGIK